jgi:predicted acetyltransferase
MEIITYAELKNKDEYMMLMEMAFWWPVVPRRFDRITKWDERLKNGPIGFCAMENRRLASHVGVMNIPLRTLKGEVEVVGGISAVATNPDFANRSLAGILMEKAHQYFREKGYRFSFLTTNRTIRAHAGYKKLGYVEVESMNRIPSVYKILKKGSSVKKPTKRELNPNKVYSLFEKFVKDKSGFVIRQKDFVKLYLFRKSIDRKAFVLMRDGYAFLNKDRGATRIHEMVASNEATYQKLVIESERMSTGIIIDRSVYDPKLLKVYKSRGYKTQLGSNSVLMVKPLDKIDYREVFGDSIYLGFLDWF